MLYPIILALIVSLYGIYSIPEVKGWAGECVVKLVLLMLPADEYIVMNDIYIPAYDGMYTQIDHLVIFLGGIIVIETKNYSGKLSGNSRKKYWISNRDGEKGKVYNPIRQNSYHIKMLRENCPGLEDEKIYSIICLSFGARAEVETRIPITGPFGINKVIRKINEKQTIKTNDIHTTAEKISRIIIKGRGIQKEHRRKLMVRKKRFQKGLCPRCSAKLLRRRGVRGEYLICSNYPICKFRASNRFD